MSSALNTSLQNEDDLDDDDDDDENENKKEEGGSQKPVNPERLKAFNVSKFSSILYPGVFNTFSQVDFRENRTWNIIFSFGSPLKNLCHSS